MTHVNIYVDDEDEGDRTSVCDVSALTSQTIQIDDYSEEITKVFQIPPHLLKDPQVMNSPPQENGGNISPMTFRDRWFFRLFFKLLAFAGGGCSLAPVDDVSQDFSSSTDPAVWCAPVQAHGGVGTDYFFRLDVFKADQLCGSAEVTVSRETRGVLPVQFTGCASDGDPGKEAQLSLLSRDLRVWNVPVVNPRVPFPAYSQPVGEFRTEMVGARIDAAWSLTPGASAACVRQPGPHDAQCQAQGYDYGEPAGYVPPLNGTIGEQCERLLPSDPWCCRR